MTTPIFVMGGKHSGTTLTATILGANSKCSLIPMECGAYSIRHIKNLRKTFVKQTASVESEFLVEKTPDHVYQIDKIQEDWPNSPIFIVTRDPFDRVASTLRRHGNFGQSVYECVNDMTACIYAIQKPNTFLVRYENIVKNFNNTVKDMCNFAGLEFEESMVNFHENAPTWYKHLQEDGHHKLRSSQMKMPLYDDSGWGTEFLTKDQLGQVEFDCVEKYELLLSLTNSNQ
jgi:hypothetical protein